jgi:hypothetical protein
MFNLGTSKRGANTWRKVSNLLFVSALPLVATQAAFAGQGTITWAANASAVDGYNVYYGTSSGNYSTKLSAGNQTSYTVANLNAGSTYYFAVTAYVGASESTYSTEVSGTVPAPTPTPTTPVITPTATPKPTSVPTPTTVVPGPTPTAAPVTPTPTVIGTESRLLTTQVPDLPGATDGRSYELGMKFQAGKAGYVRAVRHWKSPGETGSHTGHIWSAAGTLLASVDFTNESSSGWQEQALTAPLAIQAGTTYVVTVNVNLNYPFTSQGLGSLLTSGDLRSVADGANGIFGDIGTFPGNTYQNANYFRDVVFSAAPVTTSVPTASPTPVATATPKPTATPIPTAIPTPTLVPTPVPTVVVTPTPTTGQVKPVAAYSFNEGRGMYAVDVTGNGNHGTITNGTWRSGRYGNSLYFNGTDSWVTVKDSPKLDFTTGLTLEAWVNAATSMTDWRTVISKEAPDSVIYDLDANSDSDQPAGGVKIAGQGRVVRGGSLLYPNMWTHLAATYDGQTQRLYVNGMQVSSSPQTGLLETSDGVLRIGANRTFGSFFNGRMDEVRLFDRARSAAEVQADMNAKLSTVNLLGSSTTGSTVDGNTSGTAKAFRVNATGPGSLAMLSLYVDATSTASQLEAGIYADANGHPGPLIAKGKLSTIVAGRWNTIPMPPATINANQTYWIALMAPSGNLKFRTAATTGSVAESSAEATLTTLPARWTTGVLASGAAISMYGSGN